MNHSLLSLSNIPFCAYFNHNIIKFQGACNYATHQTLLCYWGWFFSRWNQQSSYNLEVTLCKYIIVTLLCVQVCITKIRAPMTVLHTKGVFYYWGFLFLEVQGELWFRSCHLGCPLHNYHGDIADTVYTTYRLMFFGHKLEKFVHQQPIYVVHKKIQNKNLKIFILKILAIGIEKIRKKGATFQVNE